MPWSMRYIKHNNNLYALLLSCQPITGAGFFPRHIAGSEAIARRVCEPAAPDVSESSIIADVCNQALADDFPTCSDEMTIHMQQSATNTCGQYFGLFTDCLTAHNGDDPACSDSLFGYQDCNNYTMQAYAYCGCYYSLPASLAACADEQLRPQAQDTAMVPRISALRIAIPTSSDMIASATKEPTPAVLTVSGGATLPSSQSLVTFSDPSIPSVHTVHVTSREWTIPSSDLGHVWGSSAPKSTSTELITVVVTHTTTFAAAGDTTTATLTSASLSTAYICANDGDVRLPTPISAASAFNIPTTFVLVAPTSPQPFPPDSALVPAQSTRAREASIPPSVATPVLSTGIVGPSEAAAGQKESAVCARCGRRSKIF